MTNSTLWSVFSRGPILEVLGSYLEIGDIIALSRTCTGLSGIYQALLPSQWNVDQSLKRFFDQPQVFRYHLGIAEALIIGGFALEFFERGAQESTSLDIVVTDGEPLGQLADHLIHAQSYQMTSCREAQPFKYVIQVREYLHDIDGEARTEAQKVRLFVVSKSSFPVRSVLEGAWTTSIANFLAWDMAYSIFPSDTFLRQQSYLLQRPGGDTDLPIRIYSQRRFIFDMAIPNPPDLSQTRPALRKVRKIDDRLAWRIPLQTDGINLPSSTSLARSEDHVAISEMISGMDRFSLDFLQRTGACKLSGLYAHYYNVKYMRYCGFLY